MNKSQSAFTLVELLMVIAIIAMISALAIQKLSGIQSKSADKLNRANVVRIGSALETYVIANGREASFDRLDALVLDGTGSGTGGGTDSLSSTDGLMAYATASNIGLSSNLTAGISMPYMSFPAILGVYHLSEGDARALREDLGMSYVMRAADAGKDYHRLSGADGVWAGQVDITDPNTCSSIAHAVTNGMAVAAVNPGSVLPSGDSIAPAGAAIYKAVGQDVQYRGDARIQVDGTAYADGKAAFAALQGAGGSGILLAFGLGDNAALIGKNVGGFDSAPISPIAERNEYGRYLVLVRLRRTGSGGIKAEYAGVMDPHGRTAAMLPQR